MKTTFVERANTNRRVFEEANKHKNPKQAPGKNILPFSEYVEQQQLSLLTHTVRANDEDPHRQCALTKGTPFPLEHEPRRVGRPRENWAWHCYENLYVKNHFGNRQDFKRNRMANVRIMHPRIHNKTITIK